MRNLFYLGSTEMADTVLFLDRDSEVQEEIKSRVQPRTMRSQARSQQNFNIFRCERG